MPLNSATKQRCTSARIGVGQLHIVGDGDTDVVQPDVAAIEPEAERPLVEGAQAELVEQRQHVGERDRLAAPIDAEPPAAVGTLQQVSGQLALDRWREHRC